MTPTLSPNTQAILLLMAPLIAARDNSSSDLLSPGEYKQLARCLRDMQRQPADLLSLDAADLIRDCQPFVDETRLQRLLGRGFLLSQVIERWQSRAIWVVSRADADYPRRLKARMREDAPAVLYGCGDTSLLESGGLAVVGSRDADDTLIAYTKNVGRLAANAGKTVVSGGARGIDQAAMLGALEQGGKVIGVLADSLEKSAMNREHRNMLINRHLVLISSYDPSAGFNVGNAMRRNKLIYALADASLVVSSDLNKGGTWAGATEQLDKLRMVPVYVRSTGENSPGIEALHKKGAIPWPDPQDVNALKEVFDVAALATPNAAQVGLPLFSNDVPPVSVPHTQSEVTLDLQSVPEPEKEPLLPVAVAREDPGAAEPSDSLGIAVQEPEARFESGDMLVQVAISPADALLAAVREVLQRLLIAPMKDVEVAAALDVSTAQAKTWLRRLVDEGILEKRNRPDRYIAKESRLFD
jgi:predicted Rossmann fold nucleotide-binding protein DprA/Smf involved in DNA uptake